MRNGVIDADTGRARKAVKRFRRRHRALALQHRAANIVQLCCGHARFHGLGHALQGARNDPPDLAQRLQLCVL